VRSPLAKGRTRAKIERLEEALAGRFGAHHAIVARQIIDHLDFLDHAVNVLTAEITIRLVPFDHAVAIVTSIPGISRTTAEVIVAETVADMSRFPTPKQFCAWAGVAPASYESAGKRRSAGTRQGSPWLRRTLIEAARAAHQGHLLLRPVFTHRSTTRSQQGGRCGYPLHDVHHVAFAHQRCPLREPRRRLLRAPTRSPCRDEATRTKDRGARLSGEFELGGCVVPTHNNSPSNVDSSRPGHVNTGAFLPRKWSQPRP